MVSAPVGTDREADGNMTYLECQECGVSFRPTDWNDERQRQCPDCGALNCIEKDDDDE